MNRLSCALIALLALSACVATKADDGTIPQLAAKARAEAKKWHSDAQLVQIEVSNFGFALDKSGLPDMTKAGPPGMVLFHFLSPSAHQALRIGVQPNLTPEQLKFLQARGVGTLSVEQLQTPYSPYTLPIPAKFLDPEQAIAQAQKDVASDCAEAKPGMSSCSLVQQAELHMYWNGAAGDSGQPVWKISFGQHPRTLQTVSREVDATSGALVALIDLQGGSINEDTNGRGQELNLANIGNDFDAVWRAVNQAVAKQDPLYKPYAATLLLYLRDNQTANSTVSLAEAEFQYARITPSFYWDDVIAHVKWQRSYAILDLSPPVRRHAPEEPLPRTMEFQKLPSQDALVHQLIGVFPPGYAEQYTTWERGCQDLMTVSPNIKAWECGVLVPTRHRTDEIHIWLTRQGNPYWRSEAAPLPSEYSLISQDAPQDKWIWWTRVMQNNQWQYHLVDPASGSETTVCTVPPEGSDPSPAPVQTCRW